MGKLVGKRWLSEQRQRQQRSGSSSRETQGAPWGVAERALSWRLAPARQAGGVRNRVMY